MISQRGQGVAPTYYSTKFPGKLHDENWAEGGGRPSKILLCRSATATCTISSRSHLLRAKLMSVSVSQLKSHLPLLLVKINIFSLIFCALTGYITPIKLLLA